MYNGFITVFKKTWLNVPARYLQWLYSQLYWFFNVWGYIIGVIDVVNLRMFLASLVYKEQFYI